MGRLVKSKVRVSSNIKLKRTERALASALKKEATKASRAIVRQNKVTKKRATGKYYSNITGKEYDTYERAHAAGEIYKKKVGSGRYISPTKSALYNKYLEDALEKRALEKTRREERKAAKALQKLEEQKEEYDYSSYDEDEYEDVTEEVLEAFKGFDRYEDEIWVYWEDVSHGILGNKWYWGHETGDWLYDNGFDSWELQQLVSNNAAYGVSRDGHTNIDFVKQAIKDSQYNGMYEVREDNGEYYIAKL